MRIKILAFVLVSAAFFLSCSADGFITHTPQYYCYKELPQGTMCQDLSEITEDVCLNTLGGEIVTSCPEE
jgi:hypothetical protein